jgi:hypothetical protein
MVERIEQIKKINGPWMQSEFFSPAANSEISDYEKSMQIVIPESYKAFLRLSNGARLFGGDCFLYSIDLNDQFKINYDFSNGLVPKDLLILGFYNSSHICYDTRYDLFFFYEYEDYDYDSLKEEGMAFSNFYEVLDYMIDIASN